MLRHSILHNISNNKMENTINNKAMAKAKATAKDTEQAQEIWVNVPDEPYNNTYMVSNMGRIKNKNTGQIKSLSKNQGGFTYVRIDIGKKAKKITYQIHQLVAKMFNGECPKDHFVVHKDSNKDNNAASNLTYMTKSAAKLRYHNLNKKEDLSKSKSKSDSESESESESDVEETKVKQVISTKAKQQIKEKTIPKKVVTTSSSESESEDETISLKEYKILQAKIKTLEEENKSLKKQLNIKEPDKTPSIEKKSATENKTHSKPERKQVHEFTRYEVDKKGNVYTNGYMVKPYINCNGYHRISLSMNDGTTKLRQNKYVHRLVAGAWIPNPKNLPYVNHINANKIDNRVENLEWCTASENMLHDSKLRKTGKRIYAFDSKTGKFYKSYESIKAAGRAIGIDSTSITKVVSGNRVTAGGYFWKEGEYDNEDEISDIDEELIEQAKKLDRYRKNKIAPQEPKKQDSSESESDSDSQ
jgi:hypothetical protein